MRNTVFIHTNPKQAVGALVARHALIRNSAAPERFDVRIIDTSDFPAFAALRGPQLPARRQAGGLAQRRPAVVHAAALLPPELMGYAGPRAS